MNDNKNRLREDAIEFALQISDLCEKLKVVLFTSIKLFVLHQPLNNIS